MKPACPGPATSLSLVTPLSQNWHSAGSRPARDSPRSPSRGHRGAGAGGGGSRVGDTAARRVGTLSLLAAVPAALRERQGRSPVTVPGVRQCLTPPLPSAGIAKGTRGQRRGRDCSLQGAWKDSCSWRASELMCLQGQQDRGDKHLSGQFVLPETTGTAGHSRCGCHRALTPSQEGTGAARPPWPLPGLCQSQPMVSRGRGALPDPCSGQDVPAHAPEPPERRNLSPAEIRAQFLGADLSCCRALPADFGSPQKLRQSSITLCQLLIRSQTLGLYLWSQKCDTLIFLKDTGDMWPQPCAPKSAADTSSCTFSSV